MRGLQEKKLKGPAVKAGKWKAGKIIFFPLFCHRFHVRCREVKLSKCSLVVFFKGAFLILHVLALTAAPSSQKGK